VFQIRIREFLSLPDPGSVYRKNLISYLMRKNEEIRGKRLGQLWRSTGNTITKQGLNGAIPDA
jgi:hypothetical protein